MKQTISDTRGRHGSVRRTYRYDGERGGYSLVRARTGWVVEMWSCEQGTVSGLRALVPYSIVRSGIDPDHAINEYGTTYAQLVLEHACGDRRVRTLRRGHVVGGSC